MGDLNEYFSRIEFKCKCGNCDMVAVDYELLTVLTDVREYFNKPIHITSGNRCKDHNRKVGGAKNSRHTMSLAVDFNGDLDLKEVYEYLDNKYPDKYGIGLYNNWIHLDVDPIGRRRW